MAKKSAQLSDKATEAESALRTLRGDFLLIHRVDLSDHASVVTVPETVLELLKNPLPAHLNGFRLKYLQTLAGKGTTVIPKDPAEPVDTRSATSYFTREISRPADTPQNRIQGHSDNSKWLMNELFTVPKESNEGASRLALMLEQDWAPSELKRMQEDYTGRWFGGHIQFDPALKRAQILGEYGNSLDHLMLSPQLVGDRKRVADILTKFFASTKEPLYFTACDYAEEPTS